MSVITINASAQRIKLIIEALLLSSMMPISVDALVTLLKEDYPSLSKHQVDEILQDLNNEYTQRAFELVEVASGFRLQTRQDFSPWIQKLHAGTPQKYSNALLETLAIIAYKQPVTRGDIEEIRGVSSNTNIFKTLIEREWIKPAGVRDVPGKPTLYVTTKNFLDYFNLRSLQELPTLVSPFE